MCYVIGNFQVCDVKWSIYYKELVSSHGYAHNQLTVWSYPSMQWMQDLTGHTGRVSVVVVVIQFLSGVVPLAEVAKFTPFFL